jgi:hypothetical protein
MGLLTCALCGCAITAERKKGRYVYYHCTNFRGECGNSYIREERLADLLGEVIGQVQISDDVAEDIVGTLRSGNVDAERMRNETIRQLEQRRRGVLSKQDRAYDDLVAGRISEEFWTRKSQEWEAELQVIEGEQTRVHVPKAEVTVTAEKILELAKQAENVYKSQNSAEQRRLLETVLSNCTFDHGTLCPSYTSPFDLFVRGNETGDWLLRLDSNQQPSG